MNLRRSLVLGLAVLALVSASAVAQEIEVPLTAPAAAPADTTLTIGTRVVPPFAFRDNTGEWAGLSIELWRDIAARLGLTYRFEEASLAELVDGTASGRFDAAVAALTVTEERERMLDFTHPFFSTGLAIATAPSEGSVWATLSGLVTWQAMLVVAFVVLALVVVGLLLWATERHRNAEYFGGPPLDGIAGGVWLSLAMLVTTQYADQSPRSLAGRFVSTLWVIASIFLFTVFTGIVTSALTVQQIDGRVRGVSDLPNLRVGTLQGSTSAAWLVEERIVAAPFDTAEAGMTAIEDGAIDAFVYDAPVLKHLALTEFAGRVVVLGGTFAPQDYAIALPENSPLREAINRELLAIKQSDIWAQRVFQYIGDR